MVELFTWGADPVVFDVPTFLLLLPFVPLLPKLPLWPTALLLELDEVVPVLVALPLLLAKLAPRANTLAVVS